MKKCSEFNNTNVYIYLLASFSCFILWTFSSLRPQCYVTCTQTGKKIRIVELTINKRLMGHIAHLSEKKFHSINTFAQSNDYAITLWEKKSVSLFWELNGWLSIKTWIPFTQRYRAPSLVEVGPVVLQKMIFKSLQWFFVISLLSPLRRKSGLLF